VSDHYVRRRYLLNFDSRKLGQVFTDVLVIGGGVAGLRAAIEAGATADVILITKDRVPDSNTAWAQGGVAVVTDPADSVEAHVADTLAVSAGLGHRDATQIMAKSADTRLRELIDWGARFDLEDGAVALGMEGGHTARRIVHALGDATGRELVRVLSARARQIEGLRIFEQCYVVDIVTEEGRCTAALTHHEKYGHQIIWAKQIVLAAGGAGCLFRETTNPPYATADGHAVAFRAGIKLRDMEFVQFHPTALYIAGASRLLISEAVRGEGAHLLDRDGNRFMADYDARGELAPRDVVSRAILRHIAATGSTCVFLDVRHMGPGRFAERFPTITQICADFDIDPARDLIPVRPAAHYMIGGVAVDLVGQSSVPGLFACGEVAATGIHGANRLASNSLLEGLVFGHRAGQAAALLASAEPGQRPPRQLSAQTDPSQRTILDLPDVRNSLCAVCWRNLGVERTGGRLEETLDISGFWGRYVMDKVLEERGGWETQNMLTVGRLIAMAALARRESRGVHFRADFPDTNDGEFLGHICLQRSREGVTQSFEPLPEQATT